MNKDVEKRLLPTESKTERPDVIDICLDVIIVTMTLFLVAIAVIFVIAIARAFLNEEICG